MTDSAINRISVGDINAAKIAAGVILRRKMIVESAIAKDAEDATMLKLKGYEQSLTDPELWHLWK